MVHTENIKKPIVRSGEAPPKAQPQVPCYFVFGASYYDDGNNNRLLTLAKSNYPPYGIDFLQGPTGRFTNGRTTADFLAEFLGFSHFIPSFASQSNRKCNKDILQGINYASGSSGILKETGRHVGARIGMDGQLQNHKTIISRISTLLGNTTDSYLNSCLYTVAMGDNDYIGNYFLPLFYNTSRHYSPQQYAFRLLEQYSKQLTSLHELGARKIALFGIPPLDCSPDANSKHFAAKNYSECVGEKTHAIGLFNAGLKGLVDQLNKDLRDARFMLVDAYGISRSSVSKFKVTDAACCKTEPRVGLSICIPRVDPCAERNDYMWWDAVHQTEAAYRINAQRAFKAQSPTDTYPVDITQLLQL
ncbi:hypothetical protein GH714_001174 [Hevea brasiliensis]|uniref:Uncharacterized protein n=1 Tax=Hevea brasiliensis TaxID=3981 RepID=A0A6A6MAF9_HEVBR|nr:hypothetical protein GH714_001174 [Hevea brasiliensis]